MGRYYSGDIEGKFWFAVQSSDDADFFGVKGSEPNYLSYYFSKEDLPKIEEGIKKCLEALGKYESLLRKFFVKHSYYNDDELKKALKIKSKDKIKELLEWYARLELGNEILECVKKTGECSFNAEL